MSLLSLLETVSQEFDVREIAVAGSHTRPVRYAQQTPAAGTNPRRFLVASLTKPVVAMGLLQLAGEGLVTLNERIGRFLPAFHKSAFRRITVRHLLTHTAGFAEMVPDNLSLRAAHASLAEFTKAAASGQPDHPPDTHCRYSSIGFLLLGDIIARIAGEPCQQFLEDALFGPLKMPHTHLGIPGDELSRAATSIAPCRLPPWQSADSNWNWNSDYWRSLGAPWGGLISTAGDLARFCRMMISDGVVEGRQVVPGSVVRQCLRDQIAPLTADESFQGPARPWGLGWRGQWPRHHASFGDFVSESAMGHWGTTGTLMWIDPPAQRYAVILSETPFERSHTALQRISNRLAAN